MRFVPMLRYSRVHFDSRSEVYGRVMRFLHLPGYLNFPFSISGRQQGLFHRPASDSCRVPIRQFTASVT